VHLGEIDERKLYAECAFPSMFEFCVGELRFSEDAAYNRITVARAARRFPAVIEAMRSGQVHLSGLRVLAPHLTTGNEREVLAQAAGKTKREIEELVARLAPQAPVPATIRKLPQRAAPASAAPLALALDPVLPSPPTREDRRPTIAPLAEDMYKVQFTASRVFREKLGQARDLLRHRVPDGDLACILERALDLLIERVKKERFAVGRKPRHGSAPAVHDASSRHVPDAIYGRALMEKARSSRISSRPGAGRAASETATRQLELTQPAQVSTAGGPDS
jgi:hypothetical protein